MIVKTIGFEEFSRDSIFGDIEASVENLGYNLQDVNTAACAQEWIDHACETFMGRAVIDIDQVTICADDADDYIQTKSDVEQFLCSDGEIYAIIRDNVIDS